MNVHDKEILIDELEEHIAQVRACTFRNPFLNLFNDDGLVRGCQVKSKRLFNIIDGYDYFHYHAPTEVIEATLDGIERDTWNIQ